MPEFKTWKPENIELLLGDQPGTVTTKRRAGALSV
jgi:hypothetical protein